MKLGCFQSNKGLRQLDFQDFVQRAAKLGYEAIDIPMDEAGAADYLSLSWIGCTFSRPALSAGPERGAVGSGRDHHQLARNAIDSIRPHKRYPRITSIIGRAPDRSGDENIAIFAEVFHASAAHADGQKGVNWPSRTGRATIPCWLPHLRCGMLCSPPYPPRR